MNNNKPRRLTGLALKLAAVAAAVLPVFAVAPGAAAAQQAPAAAANVLNCTTDTDGYWGHAHCTNNTGVVTAFRVTVVCGEWPDTAGDWKTLKPGASDVSSARCIAGTGVGSVGWEEG
ncbi:hypothetical protein GCM10009837_16050 [Streptomyces durmitorensis]|uniref:Secreted protein n=1 Tax=Streptomyces durmitorensis TaxID=319947 RepID=A0ABY4PR37_9ACTN|nr:hypothetical protein [Streptomyces durmitorensis]UQT55684.1 hypothetical protein M4V62_11580 [Streptomyces durmitorensis]